MQVGGWLWRPGGLRTRARHSCPQDRALQSYSLGLPGSGAQATQAGTRVSTVPSNCSLTQPHHTSLHAILPRAGDVRSSSYS